MEGGIVSTLLLGVLAVHGIQGQTPEFFDAMKTKHEKERRGIYITAASAGSAAKQKQLFSLMKSSNLNAAVIDVKDSTGRIFFKTYVPLSEKIKAEKLKTAPDFGGFLKKLKDNKIYTIARIAVFEDPYLAENVPEVAVKKKDGKIWRDRKGLAWVDPASPLVWKYNVDIAKSAILLGFDEINFDYIRFPTDGNLNDIVYPVFDETKEEMTDVIAQFFSYVHDSLKHYPVYTSVDLFGITLWRDDGSSIGQKYQDAANLVDYISPMVYPSHYPEGFEGYDNPAEYPYEIVYKSLEKSRGFMKGKKAKMRPWLQDFDLGAMYDSEKINAQIRATRDGGGFGYMFWNASNNYTNEAFVKTAINP